MDLQSMRRSIDQIDTRIIRLLNKRIEYAIRTRRFKEATTDTSREALVLESIRAHSRWLVSPDFSEKLFSMILGESKRLQELPLTLVGFQGEHGALSELAIESYNNDWIPIPCASYIDVMEGIRTGGIDKGIVPVESSIEGGISQVTDLLITSDVQIVGEIQMPVHHCLLALPDADHREIKIAYSHPQALAHCRGFLSRNKLEGRPYHDAASAALMLVQDRPTASAVIASPLCAKVYGLNVLMEGIEDSKNNTMRFVVISKEKSQEAGNKCSLVFTLQHKAGALFEVLKLFYEAKVNLTRLESHMLKGEAGKVAFILDFEGSNQDKKVAQILESIKEQAPMYKFLGCYKEIVL